MDMHFTYVGAGMDGSCHDMAVLRDCMETANFPHPPPRRYYLADSAYALQEGYLGPYRYARYHLNEFSRKGAETMQENFNYQHASLQNVVEWAFVNNFLLDRSLANRPETNITGVADYVASEWVTANASVDMATLWDWITLGLCL
ncbi:hypothetical protein U9M48_005514 [Paspalum notatum var. saurae]|uniref:DDE Tnp4 domain-containing protein n=1 Tax=Paspalum notatum var. saurae TaxID=547442 RepID=A0AAQ3PVU0_PASNO